jgi:hypothetical protein
VATHAGSNGDTTQLEDTRAQLLAQLRNQLRALREADGGGGLGLGQLLRAAAEAALVEGGGGLSAGAALLGALGRAVTAEGQHAGACEGSLKWAVRGRE